MCRIIFKDMSVYCPVCGEVLDGCDAIIRKIEGLYDPCPLCTPPGLSRFRSLMDQVQGSGEVCGCGRRHLDSVMADVCSIMISSGLIGPDSSLRDAGVPLITPAFPLGSPPFLPEKSLVLLSPKVDRETAREILKEVPEVKGVMRGDPGKTPGIFNSRATPPCL